MRNGSRDMLIRTIITERSVWKFNLDAMYYVRFPRGEGPRPSAIPYTCRWEPFTAIEPDGDRVAVMRPVPYGTGAIRLTGPIESDTHPGPWPELEPASSEAADSQNASSDDATSPLERRRQDSS